jgi:YHS domain-containing protein
MLDLENLVGRIDAEFSIVEAKYKNAMVENLQTYKDRQKRLEKLAMVFDQLREVWRPRLEVLTNKFGDRVQVTPRLIPSTREATFEFQSRLARIRLKFGATTDRDITKVILNYDLDIIPVFMQYDAHVEMELPLDSVDPEIVGRWIDDRIVSFVKTYLSLQENEQYVKDEMVVDPIADVRFPKFAASSSLESKGTTYFFISEETRREFEKKQGITSK